MGKKQDKDYVILGSKILDDRGTKACLLHRAGSKGFEVGEVSPVREGEPIHHALVIDGTPDAEGRYEVQAEITNGGPPKVTSNKYREGWDRVFGSKDDIVSEMINPCRHYGPDLDPQDLN